MEDKGLMVFVFALGAALSLFHNPFSTWEESAPTNADEFQYTSLIVPGEYDQPKTAHKEEERTWALHMKSLENVVLSISDKSLTSSFDKAAVQKSEQCTSKDQFSVQAPYVCVGGSIAAITSLSQSIEITADVLKNDWAPAYAIIIIRPPDATQLLPEISYLSHLQYIYLEGSVNGNAPDEIWQLQDLEYIGINSCPDLTGSVAESLSLPSLKFIHITSCQLSSALPPALFQMSKIEELEFSGNRLNGTISPEISQLTALNMLLLHANQFEGSIPSQLGKLTLLSSLSLHDNQFGGSIPTQLGLLNALTKLDLSTNKLTGTIPSQLGRLTKLTQLALQSNFLSGLLPSEFGALTLLTTHDAFIGVSFNSLEGSIPAEVRNLYVECNRSGLDSPTCARDCQKCSITQFEFAKCDARGMNQKCVPGYLLLPAVLVFVCIVGIVIRKISPPGVPRPTFIVQAITSSFAIADVATDIAFAINTQVHGLFVASVTVVTCFLFVSFIVSLLAVSRTAADIGIDGRFKNVRFRERTYNNHLMLLLTMVIGTMNPRSLPFILSETGIPAQTHDERVGLRTIAGVITVLLENLPQFSLQVAAFALGEKKLLVVVSLGITVISVLIECVTVFFYRVLNHTPEVIFTPARRLTLQFVERFASPSKARPSNAQTVELQQKHNNNNNNNNNDNNNSNNTQLKSDLISAATSATKSPNTDDDDHNNSNSNLDNTVDLTLIDDDDDLSKVSERGVKSSDSYDIVQGGKGRMFVIGGGSDLSSEKNVREAIPSLSFVEKSLLSNENDPDNTAN